jgi:hypothetical protein
MRRNPRLAFTDGTTRQGSLSWICCSWSTGLPTATLAIAMVTSVPVTSRVPDAEPGLVDLGATAV